jgi:hypothetical protein
MADELEFLTHRLNCFIEQDRFEDAQALLPEYTRALDQQLRGADGPEALRRAIVTFQSALAKTKTSRAHLSTQLADVNRAQAYSGTPEPVGACDIVG